MNFLKDLQNDFIRQFRTIPSVTTSIFDLITYLEASPNFPIRVLNGFATLMILENGSITEEFFDVGNNTATYSHTY